MDQKAGRDCKTESIKGFTGANIGIVSIFPQISQEIIVRPELRKITKSNKKVAKTFGN